MIRLRHLLLNCLSVVMPPLEGERDELSKHSRRAGRQSCHHHFEPSGETQFLAAKYGRANSTWSLPLVVGLPKAKELLYTGRPVKADEAERVGLLNQVVPCAKLREASIEMAKQISENDPRMVQGIKQLLNDDVGLEWRERFDAEQNARKNNLKANSPREGFKAFLERKGIS